MRDCASKIGNWNLNATLRNRRARSELPLTAGKIHRCRRVMRRAPPVHKTRSSFAIQEIRIPHPFAALSRPLVGFADASRFLRVRTCPITVSALAGSSLTNVAPATSGCNLSPRRHEFRRRRRRARLACRFPLPSPRQPLASFYVGGSKECKCQEHSSGGLSHSEMGLALSRLTRESNLVREVRSAATMRAIWQMP
jgi:hypothetical protein